MAGSVAASPTYSLTPSASKSTLPSNYLVEADFTWLQQYLPDTYEKEFERYGNRSVASFLRLVGAELPSTSDLIKWEEQGRLHTKFTGCTTTTAAGATALTNIPWITAGAVACNFRVGQTLFISEETAGSTNSNKAIVTAVGADTALGTVDAFEVAYYEASQAMANATNCTVFVYGSEFKQGANGMVGSLEADPNIFSNKPIIIKDKYIVSGSDMAQIGWRFRVPLVLEIRARDSSPL